MIAVRTPQLRIQPLGVKKSPVVMSRVLTQWWQEVPSR